MICAIAECESPARSRGWCTKHYQRWQISGDPRVLQRFGRGATIRERLDRYSMRNASGCLEWTGALNKRGYGKFQTKGRTVGAHRASWEAEHGVSVPEGMFVCHRCDNRKCIAPEHLFIGTPAENAQDCVAKGRKALVTGEAHHLTSLTAADVEALRRDHEHGVPRGDLAARFGVSRTTVARIVRGESWATVAPELKENAA